MLANSHDSAPKAITLFENTLLYNEANDQSAPVGAISPQSVKVTGLEQGWLYKDDPWVRISTWMGDKWIHPSLAYGGEETAATNKISLTGEEELYNYPLSNYPTGATIKPQTVQAQSILGPWIKIQTWLGTKWILPKHPVISEEPR
ncbi:hypothetical protein [Paenibacillus sp. N3.4]|uniref:hypothetical protein n=1 Tax=Paenibacillus sp. N3.4 TaxID=2603222 RepID=UPI0011C98141|nr:hypothetical protein [Paenibacillus sp. N3.4]TXK77577.1 hypothetical protein FU659_22545 [Paenibacillus sp. N3.4]